MQLEGVPPVTEYIKGGVLQQVLVPVLRSFQSLEHRLLNPVKRA